MRFYCMTAGAGENPLPCQPELGTAYLKELASQIERYNESRFPEQEAFLFLSQISSTHITVGAIFEDRRLSADEEFAGFFQALEIECGDGAMEEITGRRLYAMLDTAEECGLIRESYAVTEMFPGLEKYRDSYRMRPRESVLREFPTKAEILRQARELPCAQTLLPELKRIYVKPAAGKAMGHPVHYILEMDDRDCRTKALLLLLTALHANGRIGNARYTILSWMEDAEEMYHIAAGGALVCSILGSRYTREVADADSEAVEQACRYMSRSRDKVLTIFSLPVACTALRDTIFQYAHNTVFVEIREERLDGQQAKSYLQSLAKREGLRADHQLYQCLEGQDDPFEASELNERFQAWHDKKLRQRVYPQYADLTAVVRKTPDRGKASAYEELQAMIGLERAKAMVDSILNFSDVQSLFQEKGMPQRRISLHMVFTGNPGSAKTTVARLIARILRDRGVLSRGRLVETGRADLVGKYVGWTAQLVKEKFQAAKGSVLFIDEAYSLLDDRAGMYGDEAINTIVQEMENHRSDVVVIFAGYPDKMEEFLSRNPGLKSRIAFHVPFDDYSPDELCQITQLLAKQEGLMLAPGAQDKLFPIFAQAVREPDFGNGRFARNLLDRARLRQVSRLVRMEFVSRKDMETLLPEDFEPLESRKHTQVKVIGFAG